MNRKELALRRLARLTKLKDWLAVAEDDPSEPSLPAQKWDDVWPFLKDWSFNPEELFTARLPLDQETIHTETSREKGWNGQ